MKRTKRIKEAALLAGEEKLQMEATKAENSAAAQVARLLNKARANAYLDLLDLDGTKIVQLPNFDNGNFGPSHALQQERFRTEHDLPDWSYVEAALDARGYSAMTGAHSEMKDEPLWGKRFAVPRKLFSQLRYQEPLK